MRNSFLIFLSLVLLISGCTEKVPPEPVSPLASGTAPFITGAPSQASMISKPSPKADTTKLSPLEAAQKDYLAAYDEYVRLLRESGPQTLETLQALADYQKKYQLYQKMLQAEKSGLLKQRGQ